MNKPQPITHAGARAEPRGPAPLAAESDRAAVVEAARNLVHMKGAIAFLNPEKAMAWADLQVAIDAMESS
jgi:hypothetical protein